MRQTSHRSSAVRAYKRPGVAHMLVSAILQPPKKSRLDDEQCVLPLVPNRDPLGECSKQLPQGVDPLLKSQVWNSPFQMSPNRLLFSVLPRLKSSESSMFGSKSSNSNALKSPTAFHSKGRYSSDQEKLPHNTTTTQKVLCWMSLHSNKAKFHWFAAL